VDEIYVPVESTAEDFEKIIRSIKIHAPDVIVSTVVGTGSQQLFERFHAAGLNPRDTPIASLTMTEAEVSNVPPEIVAGHLTSASFFENLDLPEARRFVAAFKERFGASAPITSSAEAVYCQVHLFAKALALAGDDDPDLIAKHLRGMEFNAPQGRIRIDPDNHHTELWSRIARINEAGQFDIVWQSENRIRPDVYFVTSESCFKVSRVYAFRFCIRRMRKAKCSLNILIASAAHVRPHGHCRRRLVQRHRWSSSRLSRPIVSKS
jgi:branched-chain amino acid transport system substrate-binding protein